MVAPVVAGALIGGGASLLGGLFGDSSAKKAARRAAEQNIYQLKHQHQWEVEDLRKAGLNPILSGTGGGGSGTISTPVAQTGQTGKAMSEIGQKMMDRQLFNAQIENLQVNTAKTQAETENARTIGVDLENTNDMKWGTGTEKGQVYKENQAKIEEAVTRVLEGRQRVESAKETTRKEKMLNDAMQGNTKLQQFILSASYAEQETINRALSQASSPADFWALIKSLLPYIFK